MQTLILALLPLASSATIRVPLDEPTIQAAIESAAPGDVVLVAPGTYVEQIDLLGKAITVQSEAGPTQTVIDSQGMQSWPDFPFAAVVRMVNGEGRSTRLEGFTITGSNASVFFNEGGGGVYGAKFPTNASPTISPAAQGTRRCSQKCRPLTRWRPI